MGVYRKLSAKIKKCPLPKMEETGEGSRTRRFLVCLTCKG